ncbi:hypothetical protein FRB90_009581, partial [Tulasnella sp. 427]
RPYVTVAEALTQDWVAKYLSAKPETALRAPRVYDTFSIDTRTRPVGYIIMEYIDAPHCTNKDVDLVAQAVQTLISIKGPTSAPGPIGGGPVVHTFFVDELISPFTYDTVEELQQHINGILRRKEDTKRVNLVADASNGLFLCPCDISLGNFKKDEDGKLVVLDFRMMCFMPPCFFAIAMAKAGHYFFAQRVAKRVKYPTSNDVNRMVDASDWLNYFGYNDVGIPKDLR